ncbi:MAG: MAPEG family protein [Stellaceae bacterium]|jgi:uncharacterized MAPEG superfamily protein
MTFAYWMILVAALLPYATVRLARNGVRIDNRAPRPSAEKLKGWRKRADWAHRNHFEAFAPFAAAVIVAELAHAPQNRIDLLAGAFILLRLAFTALYIADKPAGRSVVFGLGLLCVVALFVIAA